MSLMLGTIEVRWFGEWTSQRMSLKHTKAMELSDCLFFNNYFW